MPEDQSFDDLLASLNEETPEPTPAAEPAKAAAPAPAPAPAKPAEPAKPPAQRVPAVADLTPEQKELQKYKREVAAYRKFGKPDELEASQKRLQELAGNKNYTDPEKEAIRAKFLEVFPELGGVAKSQSEGLDTVKQFGDNYFGQMLEKIGFVPTPENQGYLSQMVTTAINNDPRLVQMAKQGDTNVYIEAFKALGRQGMLPRPDPRMMAAWQAKKAPVDRKFVANPGPNNPNPNEPKPSPHRVSDVKTLEKLAEDYLGVS